MLRWRPNGDVDVDDANMELPQVGTPLSPRPETQMILQRIVRYRQKTNEEWVTVTDQPTLERSILLFCQQHFQQAATTPFGSGQLHEMLAASGLTMAGEQILKGTYKSPISGTSNAPRVFISRLVVPEQLWDAPPIQVEVMVEEYISTINWWDDWTSTSPSGRHLGFYKAILGLLSINSNMCVRCST